MSTTKVQKTDASKKTASVERVKSSKGGRGEDLGKKRYQAKLMLEEDAENKTVLVKIAQRTSIRQIINYSLSKIR